MKFLSEFKEFIARGNVIDMAVGVVVGGAFKGIVDSLVADIIMPAISLVTGKVNIASLAVQVPNPMNTEEVLISMNYGNFLQQVLNFLIIAFVIFCMIKMINTVHERMSKQKEFVEEAAVSPTTEELLTEIRDLLKNKDE